MEEKELIKSKPSFSIILTLGLLEFFFTILLLILGADIIDFLWILILTSIILIVIGIINKSSYLVVTDKRVYGKSGFGKRVDIPIRQVSAVGQSNFFQNVTVASSSGKISFFLSNVNEVATIINNSIMDNPTNAQPTVVAAASNADELKKYKDLLDSSVITQEEFDEKKKQLLGL